MQWGTKTNIGYYAQNLEGLEPRNDVIQELRRVAPMADNGTLRGFLAKFLFMGEDVFKPVSALSGGEKGRLALAKLIYSQKNVLVLDEPTNHLDIPSRESLENALDEYDGTIIVVSHDRFFLDKIADQMLSFENDGTVLSFDGNYTEFHDWRERQASVQSRGNTATEATTTRKRDASTVGAARQNTQSAGRVSNLSKNQRNQLEKRIKSIESEIPTLEGEASRLTRDLSDPKVASDYGRLSEVTDKLTKTEKRIQELYAEWESAAQKLS
jgi:ATP-binding cassette subfamily F protein 3